MFCNLTWQFLTTSNWYVCGRSEGTVQNTACITAITFTRFTVVFFSPSIHAMTTTVFSHFLPNFGQSHSIKPKDNVFCC
jgi:hypothetical protein